MIMDRIELSEKKKKLLQKHHDGECSWGESFVATRLLDRQVVAREYFSALGDLNSATDSDSVDLWQSIDRKIEEQSNSGLLSDNPLNWLFPEGLFRDLSWAAGGAVTAFAIAFFVFSGRVFSGGASSGGDQIPGQQIIIAAGGGTSESTQIKPVLVSNGNQADVYPVSGNQARNGRVMKSQEVRIKIDWIESDGTVQFIEDDDNSAGPPILWVKNGR